MELPVKVTADPLTWPAVKLAVAFRSGAVKVVEHTERVLELAATQNPILGAFSSLHADLSLQQAERAQAAIDAKTATSALTGVPLPIKDLVQIAGLPFEAGSPALKGNIAQQTDSIAQQIMSAQTVLIGKTTTSEFGMSVFSESPVMQARTPWDPNRTAGGSSGGAGAAVGAGILPLAHGNDAGGSVRVPAACNGVYGLLTGRGVISNGPNSADAPGFARHGVLARSPQDLKLGLDLMRHRLPGDLYNPPLALSDAQKINNQLCIGMILEPMVAHTNLHPEALTAVLRFKESLEALGHQVKEIPPAMTPQEWQNFMPLWAVGAASIPLPFGEAGTAEAITGEAAAGIGALTRWLRKIGAEISGIEYLQALHQVQALSRRMQSQWQELDLILTPMLASPPVLAVEIPTDPKADFEFQSRFTPFTSIWNMNGLAALAIPNHTALIEGKTLPFAVQLAATKPGQEELLIAVASILESKKLG